MPTALPATPPTNGIAAEAGRPRRMDPMRKVALAGGIAYLVTFAPPCRS